MTTSNIQETPQPRKPPNSKIKFISTLASWLVAALALAALALSYNALQAVAVQTGITGWRSYIWPGLIDISLVVFSLAVVRNHLRGEPTRWPWFLVGLYSAATTGFNLVHAPANVTAWLTAIVAPISLLLAFETLMSMVKSDVLRQAAVVTLADLETQAAGLTDTRDKLTGQIERSQTRLAKLKQEIRQAKRPDLASVQEMNQARQDKIQERRADVMSMLQAGRQAPDIANELDVSVKTIQRDIVALNGKGGVTK